MNHGLHWIDCFVIGAYACGMLALGWYYARRQKSTDEYFTGSRQMNPFLIGISLFATLLSTITYLSGPGEIIKHGPVLLAGSILSIPIAYLIVGYLLVPVFMRYRLTSAYELLETRLGLSTRLIGATMFIALRLIWMAVLLNFAANAMLIMFGLEGRWLFVAVLLIGSVALVYSTLGGLRAVVITDFVQFLLLLGGAILVIVIVTVRLGGLNWFPTSWESSWDTQPVVSFDPYVRMTLLGVLVMQTLWAVCTAGGDQTAIQRFMATRDAAAARRSYLTNSIAAVLVWLVLAAAGLALLGYFRAYPAALPEGKTLARAADALFPHYISHQLPIGIAGLVVSGMFAAAMSSIDSGVNSITAVVVTDFMGRFRNRNVRNDPVHRSANSPVGNPLADREAKETLPVAAKDCRREANLDTQQRNVRVARLSALVVGLIVIGSSTLIEYVPGNLIEVAKRTTGLLVTPIFTLFFMALFVRFATPTGANAGAVCGFLAAIIVSFWNPLIATRSLSITWINPTALTLGVAAGCVVSLLTPRGRDG